MDRERGRDRQHTNDKFNLTAAGKTPQLIFGCVSYSTIIKPHIQICSALRMRLARENEADNMYRDGECGVKEI